MTYDRGTRDLMDHDSRTRLAETCGTLDESPCSNLVRVKQGEAIRADVMNPTSRRQRPAMKNGMKSTTCKRLFHRDVNLESDA